MKIIYACFILLLINCKNSNEDKLGRLNNSTQYIDSIKKTISNKWYGDYSISFSKERENSTTMYWKHNFLITNKFCIYEGSGFQYYSKYNCEVKEKKDTLLIFAKENIDGYQVYNKGELIMKVYKVDGFYYTNTKDLKPEEAEDNPTNYGFKVLKSVNKTSEK